MLQGFFSLFNGSTIFNEQQRLGKLRNQLTSCTYYNNIKFLIERICMDVMKAHPQLETNILAFIQNNQPRRFIEIGGLMTYKYNNKKRTVKVFMMFNQYFPTKPPYVRVVNYQKKPVNSYFDLYQSPNDQDSYVLNSKLNNLVSWTPGKSCLPIFEELKFLLETYSFYDDKIVEYQKNQKIQKKNQIFQKKKQPEQKNQYVANRGSYYQANIKQQKPDQKTGQGDDYDMKQCKLCFNSPSCMINLSCGHIMMCEQCFRAYRKKCGSDICECPICKSKGQYIKFVQPKFA